MLEHKKNNLDRLKEDHGVNSYTIALNEEAADEIFAGSTCSQGNTLFVKRMPQFIDTNKYRLVNHNKFDFMRKVAGYMAAQKKIMKIISLKPVPDLYPRHYSDVRQLPYDPTLQVDKANKALGRTQQNPRIFL